MNERCRRPGETVKRELCEIRELSIAYAEVRALLKPNPIRFLQPAAEAGLQHAGEILTTLETDVAGLHLERQVVVGIGPYREIPPPASLLRIPVWWHAVADAQRYPMLDGWLEVYPRSTSTTRLSLQGSYTPPFGALGATLDRIILGKVAEDSVSHLVDDIAFRIVEAWHSERGDAPATNGV
jgi:hypothetical protein